MAEKVKKSIPWLIFSMLIGFIIVIAFSLNLGKPIAEADIATTTVQVGNATPTWTYIYEDPASATSTPTNAGSDVTFKGKADDPNNDDWWLIICKDTGYSTTTDGSCPTCTAGAWASSTASTTDNTEIVLTYTTSNSDVENNPWYAYACDDAGGGAQLCSDVSQGTGGTTDQNSPFVVNHRPNFPSITQNPANDPGLSVTWTANASDTDSYLHSDQVKLVVCDAQGVSGINCTGNTLCTSTLAATNPSCSYNIPDPTDDDPSPYAAWVYVFDEHNFAASGGAHDTNTQYTVNNVSPEVSNVTLNNGAIIDLQPGGEGPSGNLDIPATADVVDHNGCADVSTTTVKAYPTGVGAGGCTAQDNNTCYYNIVCSMGPCQGNGYTATTSCTMNFKYHADPTDADTPRDGQTWKDTITSQDDNASSSSSELTTGVVLQSFLSLGVTSEIQYGTLSIGQIADTDPLPKTATTTATGNTGLDVELNGTQMCTNFPTCSGGTPIATSSQRFATSSVQYQNATSVETVAKELELNCSKTTVTASPQQKANWWGLQVPGGTQLGSYTGQITYTAVKAETGDW